MRSTDLAIPACLAVLALLCAAPARGLDNANVASADEAPEVRETVPFTATINVLNANDRAVRVKLIDTSCTCTKLDLKDHFLLPGGRTTMDVEIPSTHRSGPQSVHVSLFLSDPEYQPIEIDILWKVRACVQVDAVAPNADPLERPADKGWQDVYRYWIEERPDEPNKLRKRIRLSCPPEETPSGGLKVTSIDYAGTLWAFTQKDQGNGSILILAKARDDQSDMPEGVFNEKVVIHTNHPDKAAIELLFDSSISKEAGRRAADPLEPK